MNIYLNHTLLIKKVTCDYNLGRVKAFLGLSLFTFLRWESLGSVKPEEARNRSPVLDLPRSQVSARAGDHSCSSPPAQGLQYMELIPKEKQPVTGTEGAYYRRRQLMHQLPIYDQDPSRCRGLLENELKLMEEFVKQYKSEALGVGEVALPGQGGLPKEEGKQQEKPEGTEPTAPTTNGSIGDLAKEYVSPSQACGAAAATQATLLPLIHAPLTESCLQQLLVLVHSVRGTVLGTTIHGHCPPESHCPVAVTDNQTAAA